jgi:hypothetical protein
VNAHLRLCGQGYVRQTTFAAGTELFRNL